MNLLESVLYGLISGLAEFLPVSSQAHQAIMLHLFGAKDNGLLQLFVHVGMLAALLISFHPLITRLNREMRLAQLPRKRRRREPDRYALMEVSVLKTAGTLLMLAFLLYPPAGSFNRRLNFVALFLLLNGIVLYVPQLLSTGNKDARTMSPLDAAAVGIGGALGMLPGISFLAALTAMFSVRGTDRQRAVSWSYMLLIPVLMCLIGFDIYQIASEGIGSLGVGVLFSYLAAAGAAYIGATVAVTSVRYVAVNIGFSGFAFYSWGAALFAFILYLTN